MTYKWMSLWMIRSRTVGVISLSQTKDGWMDDERSTKRDTKASLHALYT